MKERILQIIQTLLQNLQIQFEDIVIEEVASNSFSINILSLQDSGLLIGHQGATLMSLQSIIHSIAQAGSEQEVDIFVDAESYRKNLEKNILELAERKAKKVLSTQGEELMPPMLPYFRKVVHTFIADNPEFSQIKTMSVGEGKDRQLKIFYQSND